MLTAARFACHDLLARHLILDGSTYADDAAQQPIFCYDAQQSAGSHNLFLDHQDIMHHDRRDGVGLPE